MLVWQEARRQARALVEEGQLAGDPYKLCRRYGIDVRVGKLPADVSGMIIKEAGRDAEILLSQDDSQNRRRFTCAHELGHYIERTAVAGDKDFSFRDLRSPGNYDLHEFFADEFAGELLMPARTFGRDLRDGVPISSLALKYGVTISAAEKRKERLEKFSEPLAESSGK
ncbi:ImmA/IrrE family metallo-endopeptidase [Rhodococcus sp. AQ5-07]|uniref:ImmA/IrrE family metallo-endopeptidase n=1 Tax=Rhodococcus sp. AQ5-07 TaxID=2054902 RepID=UPI000DC00082|nr:ImmA/IrrE family metallo-endopeptidase [Rhodococcus sp. AQ5-07]RAL32873.1 toxin [Rhodococcus sp. AQ5-07]